MGGKPTGARRSTSEIISEHMASIYDRMYTVVRQVPRGKVATYGQVAMLAGLPGAARAAGAAMRASKPEHGLPWHRIVGKRSRTMATIAIHDPVGAGIQRAMLEDEGVELTTSGGIRLDDYGWVPID